MKASLKELTTKTLEMLGIHAMIDNSLIMKEDEECTQMNDALFMEWFIKKEERVQLYSTMKESMLTEESIWYTGNVSKYYMFEKDSFIHSLIEYLPSVPQSRTK